MGKIIGIDLGTTNSVVAIMEGKDPQVIANEEGGRLTPSVVHFSAADAEAIVGHEANRVRLVKPAETAYSIKRFMGRRGADISQDEMLVTYPVKADNTSAITIPIHGKNYSPEEISAEILKKLKLDAENYFGEEV